MEQLLYKNNGTIKSSAAIAAGVSKPVFYKFTQNQSLEPVAHGVYASADAWVDPMYLLSLRSKQVVFSHETALFLHDLTD